MRCGETFGRRGADGNLMGLISSWLKRIGSPLTLTLSQNSTIREMHRSRMLLWRGEGTGGEKNLVGWCFVGRWFGSLVEKARSRTPRRGVPT
jgi:hypothetical protein